MKAALFLPLVSMFVMLQAPAQNAPPAAKPPAPSWKSTDAYPLDTCVVSGKPFAGDKMQVVEVEGRKFKLCSAECVEKLKKDPATYVAKLDKAVVEMQTKDYPLDRCPISGKPLGSMGDPVKLVLDNHLVQLCCAGCTKKAEAKKAEIIASIEAAAYAKQKDSYPLKTCVNSGEELDPKDTIEVMHGATLLRFCCKGCIDELNNAPAKMVAKVVAARKDQKAPEKPKGDGHGGHEHGKQP